MLKTNFFYTLNEYHGLVTEHITQNSEKKSDLNFFGIISRVRSRDAGCLNQSRKTVFRTL